jgi:uncharacterized protein (UPF0264 family)
VKLLVSVADAVEARAAVDGGADVIDVKNPREGSLGAPSPAVVRGVRSVVPGNLPVSVAIGDMPNLPGTAALAALGAARCGASYVKVGLWGTASDEAAVTLLRAVREALDGCGDVKVIAGAYVDAERVPGRPIPAWRLPRCARAAGVAGCLLDTAVKDGRGLLSWMGPAALAELIREAHADGLEVALAGGLRLDDVASLGETGADIIGVRSAVCHGEVRSGALDLERVHRLRAVCAS